MTRKQQVTDEEKKAGRKLLRELYYLLNPDESGSYVDFDKPRKDIWLAFLERWGRVVHVRSPRVMRKSSASKDSQK